MRGDSVEVTFAGEILGASRDDIFRVVRNVVEAHKGHRVDPAGERGVVVRRRMGPTWFDVLLLDWWAFFFPDREETFVVNTRQTDAGTYVDVVGTGVEVVVDELGDALDALNAGGSR